MSGKEISKAKKQKPEQKYLLITYVPAIID
jgi:hypothetical protein